METNYLRRDALLNTTLACARATARVRRQRAEAEECHQDDSAQRFTSH